MHFSLFLKIFQEILIHLIASFAYPSVVDHWPPAKFGARARRTVSEPTKTLSRKLMVYAPSGLTYTVIHLHIRFSSYLRSATGNPVFGPFLIGPDYARERRTLAPKWKNTIHTALFLAPISSHSGLLRATRQETLHVVNLGLGQAPAILGISICTSFL